MQSPQPALDARIPARHRRQAMDWSLVLASQGIEHRIDYDEATGWTLAVPEADYQKAEAHIRLYRLENRHWRWRRPVFQPGMFFDWSSLVWVALIIFFYGWSEAHADLRTRGMMTGAALAQGEWWRLFTATWLHADIAHLAMNAVFGLLFLGLVMGRYGPGVGLLAAMLTGAGGNLATGWSHGATLHGLGASGVVMGALGLLTFPPLIMPKQRNKLVYKLIVGGLLAGVFIFAMIGVNPDTDVIAHLGGFVTGWLIGLALARFNRFVSHPWVNIVAGVLFVGLVILPWSFLLSPIFPPLSTDVTPPEAEWFHEVVNQALIAPPKTYGNLQSAPHRRLRSQNHRNRRQISAGRPRHPVQTVPVRFRDRHRRRRARLP